MNVANTNVAIAGGLVGDNFGLIAQSYSAGNVFTIGNQRRPRRRE